MIACDHSWMVHSTVGDGSLLVECENCGAKGVVPYPTKEEWQAAFYAPGEPYPWPQGNRVDYLMSLDESAQVAKHILQWMAMPYDLSKGGAYYRQTCLACGEGYGESFMPGTGLVLRDGCRASLADHWRAIELAQEILGEVRRYEY